MLRYSPTFRFLWQRILLEEKPDQPLRVITFYISVCVGGVCVSQMYKALEAGYQMGLESLNENLSEMRAELVFAQRVLQFKPPLEELRAAYYRDTKKFVSIPNTFGGFGNGKVRSTRT